MSWERQCLLIRTALLAAALTVARLGAADLYVDPDLGDDAVDGRAAAPVAGGSGPVRTIAHGLSLAGAGDTLHLAPRAKPYRESVIIKNRHGEADRPIVIDGHGAVLTGCDPLRPEDWQAESGGIYRSDTLYAILHGDETVIDRVFFLVDGRQQRMGRTSKGSKAPFKQPAELQVGEWTFVAENKAFYVRIADGRSLADCGFQAPVRKNGVAISGSDNAHLLIRGLSVRNFLNDGFNVHNRTRDVRFQAVSAFGCGDDGFSAHEDCECEVDGFLASGNSTGFANIGQSRVHLSNALLLDNIGYEIYQTGASVFSIRNTCIQTAAEWPVSVRGNPSRGQACAGSLENVLIRAAPGGQRRIEIAPGAQVKAVGLTCIGLDWLVSGEAELERCVVASGGGRGVLDVRGGWRGAANIYAMRTFSFGGTGLGGDFETFRRASGADAGSRTEPDAGDLARRLMEEHAPFAPAGADLSGMDLPRRP
jgi:hypothetical protein